MSALELSDADGFAKEDRLLNADQTAELIGVSAYTIRQWAREDKFPHLRLGPKTVRFRLFSVQAWMREQERAA